jgi:circadian clock protein KaiC
VDNLILLRYLELRSQLHRLISILKVRESDYDASVHEFRISLAGFAVDASSEGAEALLAEVASQRRIVTATSPANSGSTPGSAPSGEL